MLLLHQHMTHIHAFETLHRHRYMYGMPDVARLELGEKTVDPSFQAGKAALQKLAAHSEMYETQDCSAHPLLIYDPDPDPKTRRPPMSLRAFCNADHIMEESLWDDKLVSLSDA